MFIARDISAEILGGTLMLRTAGLERRECGGYVEDLRNDDASSFLPGSA